jgi:predicted pyridoxine 5'-phosphate oxidase superfamily flavin-nucleotide-binding protein
MAELLNQEVIELLQNKATVKVLTTVDEHGVPHSVVKGSLTLDEDGNLLVLELLESSRTNRNLVRSIWYDRKVAILLKGEGALAYQIKGVPVKAHISGPLFQKHYKAVRERLGDVDLGAVWIIRPEEVINESTSVRRDEEQAKHPVFIHLDRLVRA